MILKIKYGIEQNIFFIFAGAEPSPYPQTQLPPNCQSNTQSLLQTDPVTFSKAYLQSKCQTHHKAISRANPCTHKVPDCDSDSPSYWIAILTTLIASFEHAVKSSELETVQMPVSKTIFAAVASTLQTSYKNSFE